jgi:hypothetical protein
MPQNNDPIIKAYIVINPKTIFWVSRHHICLVNCYKDVIKESLDTAVTKFWLHLH